MDGGLFGAFVVAVRDAVGSLNTVYDVEDNVATNDSQDGSFDVPTMIRRRYVATSHSPTLYYCQR
jgi:hypothetical protein